MVRGDSSGRTSEAHRRVEEFSTDTRIHACVARSIVVRVTGCMYDCGRIIDALFLPFYTNGVRLR